MGTGLMLDVAEKLDVPMTALVVNEVPSTLNVHTVQAKVEAAYNCAVTAVLPQTLSCSSPLVTSCP